MTADRFNELLAEVEKEFPIYFPVRKANKPAYKKIDWEHIWANGRKTSVRIVLDPTSKTLSGEQSFFSIRGLRSDNTTYPITSECQAEVMKSLQDTENLEDFMEDYDGE